MSMIRASRVLLARTYATVRPTTTARPTTMSVHPHFDALKPKSMVAGTWHIISPTQGKDVGSVAGKHAIRASEVDRIDDGMCFTSTLSKKQTRFDENGEDGMCY